MHQSIYPVQREQMLQDTGKTGLDPDHADSTNLELSPDAPMAQ